jgi:hypothetical protein
MHSGRTLTDQCGWSIKGRTPSASPPIATVIARMPDILEPYHGDEPLSAPRDRPWVDLGSDQIRRIAELTRDHRGSVRLEYGGAGHWFVLRGEARWAIRPSLDRLGLCVHET